MTEDDRQQLSELKETATSLKELLKLRAIKRAPHFQFELQLLLHSVNSEITSLGGAHE